MTHRSRRTAAEQPDPQDAAVRRRPAGLGQLPQAQLNKVFPDHWSFMLGEIALYSFVILLLTGTYLTLFFHASQREVIYNGSYQPLRGVPMTDAYASTLHISFDVRGGLLMRQIHHWAALLFITSIVVHMFRVFFTGAFRKPRTSTGTSASACWSSRSSRASPATRCPTTCSPAPDCGSPTRSSSRSRSSAPTSSTSCSAAQFPGQDIISRLFIIHVLLIPGILLALIAAHMMILWHQKHTEFPGPGKTEDVVVGHEVLPDVLPQDQRLLLHRLRRAAPRSVRSPRSTRCGSTARTTQGRSRPARSPTGTSCSSRARCA